MLIYLTPVFDRALRRTDSGPSDTYPVFISWEDAEPFGNRRETIVPLTVTNVPPVVDAGNGQVIQEGDAATISATTTDVGRRDTHTYRVDWGDGSASSTGTLVGGVIDESHLYPDDGDFIVAVCATDDGGGTDCDFVGVVVTNAVPLVAIGGSPGTTTEGTLITLTADVSDPGPADQAAVFTIDWSVTKDGASFASDTSTSINFVVRDEGTYEVTLTAIDKDNLGDQATTTIIVANVAPAVDAGAPATINEGDTFTRSGSFFDPGVLDTHTATVDYGDGSGVQPLDLNADDTFGLSHLYADDGPYTVEVTVGDDDNASSTDTVIVTVNNVAPTVDAGTGGTIDEGGTFTSSGSFSDPGDDTFTGTVNFGDSSGDQTLDLNSDNTFALSHVYADDDQYTVTVSVVDDENATGTATALVTVNNVAPDFEAGLDGIVPPPDLGAFSRTITFTDPGADVWSGTVNFGDSSGDESLVVDQAAKSFVLNHTYLDEITYTVTVTVEDGDAGSHTDTFQVEVQFNTPPVANDGGPYTGDEGSPVAFDGSGSTDAENNIVEYAWTFGDGSTGTGATTNHTYIDNGTFTVCLTVTDSFNETSTDCTVAQIANVSPSVGADNASETVNESESAENSGTFSDSGDDIVTISASVGTVSQVVTQSGTWSWSFDTSDGTDETQTVTITATDSDLATTTTTFALQVNNVVPTIALSGASNVDEGSTYTLTLGAITDPGADAVSQYIVDWDDGSSNIYTAGGDVTHTYADGPASPTIAVDLVDKDGTHVDAGSLGLTVNNVAPNLGAITAPLDPVLIDTSIDVSAGFSDPGFDSPPGLTVEDFTAVVLWGDGTSNQTTDGTGNISLVEVPGGIGTATAGTIVASHVYDTPGVYTLTLTVTDDDAGTDQSIFDFVVVYDPDGGFVTGGGWIDSPLGACALTADCETETGKASFGFVSKYKNGATTPTGQTEFQFKAGDINFHSGNCDWLVIAGAQAKYKGTGTINGAGNYGFMLSATDGQVNGGGGVDKFRIKIWDEDNGDVVVYDNQMGAADDEDPTTAITRGSIKVHKAN